MAHSFPPLVKLKSSHNKLIRVGKSRQTGADFKASRDRSTYTSIDGQVLDKPIQVYRMWYRFLQLALELEGQKVQIVTTTKSVPLKKPKKDQWGKLRHSERVPVKKKIKVNRSKYEGWDIDCIPDTSFDHWWNGNRKNEVVAHKELFYPESSLVVLNKKDDWVDDRNFTYIRIDKRRRINDVVNDLRAMFAEQNRTPESVSDFPIFGSPNINTLINRYNALILQLTTTLKDKEMLASDVFRPTQYGMGEDDADTPSEGAYKYSGSEGRAMRDLILPAKIALLSVCDGFFTNNPNKEYL